MRVFVIGASSDIGLAVCRYYLSEGWDVLAHYRTMRPELAELAEQNSGAIELLRIDFADTANLERILAKFKDQYLACDSMINCVATLNPLKFSDITANNILEHFSVNTLPGLLLMRDMVPAMAKRGWGRIVHLGSIGVKFGGGKESFGYSLSKHALEFLPSDYKDWASKGVLVNVLRVGVTNTRLHGSDPSKNMINRIRLIPMQRMASADEVAKAVGFFGSDINSYITGQVISVSGGE
ncbi:MAG: SDR family oxidoreductase [Methylobacter sp.]|nr:SDR family oxidoreductase [Methylobacter sp.]